MCHHQDGRTVCHDHAARVGQQSKGPLAVLLDVSYHDVSLAENWLVHWDDSRER